MPGGACRRDAGGDVGTGQGKTHRAYLWAYAAGAFEPLRAVVYDFTISRAGEHARTFLGDWQGSLLCDDYGGYKALWERGVTEAGCIAHARREFHDLWANHSSTLAEQALKMFGVIYDVEREVKDLAGKAAHLPAQEPAGGRAAACLVDGEPAEAARRQRDSQGHRLQPQRWRR